MHALARLYTLAEVDEASRAMPWNELDARFKMGLGYACAWAGMPHLRCAMCNELYRLPSPERLQLLEKLVQAQDELILLRARTAAEA